MSIDNWGDDKLDRKKDAVYLTNYLTRRYSLSAKAGKGDSLVLGLRAEWGFGKTFFIKRWSSDLKDSNFPVVYFDAWENDFSDNPLIGFITALEESLKEDFDKIPKSKKILENATGIAKRIVKPVGFLLMAIATKKLLGHGIEDIKEIVEEAGIGGETIDDLISNYGLRLVEEHKEKRDLIHDFKRQLSNLVIQLEKESLVELPIFVFVDELDRCRPTYSIELLEIIKHLFGVPGIYFVISTNTEQLRHSICAVYGQNFDSEKYLKRFFEQEYLLAPPDTRKFTDYIFSRPILESMKNRDVYFVTSQISNDNAYMGAKEFSKLAKAFSLSIRDLEQISSTLEAIILNWPEDERIHFTYLMMLIAIKQIDNNFFYKIYSEDCSQEDYFAFSKINIKDVDLDIMVMKDYHSVPGTITVFETFQIYLQAAALPLDKILEKRHNTNPAGVIFEALTRDSPSTWNPRSPPPSPLRNYPIRVAQAGQLTI